MTLTENLREFFENYYRDEIGKVAQNYPTESTLWVDYRDVERWNHEIADRWTEEYDRLSQEASKAVGDVTLPADVSLDNVRVALHNLPEDMCYAPSELRDEHGGKYVGLSGNLSRVTFPDDTPTELAFECQRCGTFTYIPQSGDEMQEPHECHGCERQGPFKVDHETSEWTNVCKVQIETPPDAASKSGGESIDGTVKGDLVDYGHEIGLPGRAGEKAIVYGIVRRRQKEDLLFERYLDVKAVDFPKDDDTVDIEKHKAEFEELASRPDAIDVFANSLTPELHATDAWDTAFELAVAYLFAAPRIDIPDGPSYRGDIHMLIISDYGMGKSTFTSAIANYSPNAIRRSATSLGSDVGLTAAAVKDDFGDGQWSIKPGLLVRANNGHLILDEIDKGPDKLEKMNDALEGEQLVDVEKAGKSATYESRVGLMATGNPVEGRFEDHLAIAPQIGVDPSLLSRFDGIITMLDRPNEDQDGKVAQTIGEGYAEAQAAQFEGAEFDILDRVVDVQVGRAWIAYARENLSPRISKDQIGKIKDWYATEARQLNQKFNDNEGDGGNMPAPVTPRIVEVVIRISVAFARCELRETVSDDNIQRAIDLAKRLIKQNWDGERFDPGKVESDATQHEKMEKIADFVEGETLTTSDIADALKMEREVVDRYLQKIPQVSEVANGRWEG